jgi:hypothetical protein
MAIGLTEELLLSYRYATIWFIVCRVQKSTKQIVTLFFGLCASAIIHHFYHILLSNASAVDTTDT